MSRLICIKTAFASITLLFLFISLVSAQEYNLDIKTDKSEYSLGETLEYTILILENTNLVRDNVDVYISDALDGQVIKKTVSANSKNELTIENNFSSGYWKIETSYKDKKVKRIFSVKEKEEVLFEIIDDLLVITNRGNVPYTKKVQILIGEEIITNTQNIPVGGKNEIKLIAPNGVYNIEVTDGQQTISQREVQLTGNAVGVLDKNLAEKVPLFGNGAREPQEKNSKTQQLFSSARILPALIFILGIFVLGILSLIERKARKKKSK